VYQGTVSFLQYRILGLPFLMLTQLINGFYIAISKSRFLIYGAVVGNVINVFLDYGLIFGHWGMPLLGLRGAAYASIIAELSSMIVMYALFVAHKMQLHFAVFHHIKWNIKITRDTMKVSMPLIVQYIFSIGGWQIFFIYIEHLGIVESAASHILRSVLGIVSIGTWALASTCNSMVSNLVGQGNLQAIMALVRKILLLSFAFAASVSLLLYCFPVVFLSAYTNDAAVISTARSSLNLLCISTLIMALATICFNAVVGLGKTWINLCIEVLCVSLYVVYIVVVMGYGSGNLLMAWASEFVYWISLLVLSGLYLKLGSWQRKMQPA
jgi:MATE family multidrug resistance protein